METVQVIAIIVLIVFLYLWYKPRIVIPNTPIPKILIQTYHDKSRIPEKVYKNIQLYAPEYKHIIFDDNQIIQFLESINIGIDNKILVDTFSRLKGAHKADFFRYCYLYVNGGVYVDIKTEFIKPINTIFCKSYLYTVISWVGNNSIYQGIIASPPSNKLFLELINFMINIKEPYDYLVFTIDFYNKLKNILWKKPIAGYNGSGIYLFQENCSDQTCHDGNDRYGLCCNVYDGKELIIKTRYADYPW